MKTIVIAFDADGGARCLLNAGDALPLGELGATTMRRASNVWPKQPAKRIAFRFLRFLFGEKGKIADACRQWRGPWQVVWPGESKPVFEDASRAACIAWESETINSTL